MPNPVPQPVPRIFRRHRRGRKRVEYRQRTPFWRKRLEGRKYDAIKFRNGYASKAPEAVLRLQRR
jgi:hypothetical protein